MQVIGDFAKDGYAHIQELVPPEVARAIVARLKEATGGRPIPLSRPRAASVEQFDSGQAAIGTGPYRLKEWAKGSHITLERNETYWGPRPEWDRLELRPIAAPPAPPPWRVPLASR